MSTRSLCYSDTAGHPSAHQTCRACTHMHVCKQAQMHICIDLTPTCMQTCMLHECITLIHPCAHKLACMHTCIKTCLHPRMHYPHMLTCTQTCTHAYVHYTHTHTFSACRHAHMHVHIERMQKLTSTLLPMCFVVKCPPEAIQSSLSMFCMNLFYIAYLFLIKAAHSQNNYSVKYPVAVP